MVMNELPANAGAESAVPAATPEVPGTGGGQAQNPASDVGGGTPEAGKQVAPGTGAEGNAAAEPEDMFADFAPEAAKPEGEDGGEQKEGEKEGEAKPDETPLEIKMPEGFVENEAVMGSFRDLVKEGGIKPEVAQKLFDIHAAEVRKFGEAYREATEKAVLENNARINAAWAKECQTDPEFGGANYNASRNLVIAAIRRIVPEAEQAEFLEFYRAAQLQNNPQMFRFLARVGRETSEAGAVGSEGAAPKEEASLAKRLFPNLS